MPIELAVRSGLYKDSVSLMRIAQSLLGRAGVRQATLVMGTPSNKEILSRAGLVSGSLDGAKPSDLVIAVEADTQAQASQAVAEAAKLLEASGVPGDTGAAAELNAQSIAMALERRKATIAQISVPGAYAGAEAVKALRQGLHVFLFSDNVPLEQERAMKELADEKGLIVMGPDCGTALVSGAAFGFANVVRRGGIGLIGASGTGLQQLSCRVHDLGEGISHAIGVGGRDLRSEVGARSTLRALAWLNADPATRVIVLVSKPPAADVERSVVEAAARLGKPVVVLFLGTGASAAEPRLHRVSTLEEAALTAVALARGQRPPVESAPSQEPAMPTLPRFEPQQRYLRGLFSGGTFCTEAQLIWRRLGVASWSNVPLDKSLRLQDARRSREHTAVDLGEDEFTLGRPHPMIDYGLRIERLLSEARDPATAVILLDVVLGFGSHPDPAAALVPALREARRVAGRPLLLLGFICGTEQDPQPLSAQRAALEAEGMWLAGSSSAAASVAARVAQRLAA